MMWNEGLPDSCRERGVSEEYLTAATEFLHAKRCFFVSMDYVHEGEAVHREVYRQCFLPLLRHAGSCLLFGVNPAELATQGSSPGVIVTPAEEGAWRLEITDAFDEDVFPYWNREAARKIEFVLVIGVDFAASTAQLADLFSKTWDPGVVTNPWFLVSRPVFSYAKRNSRKGLLWLAYCINPLEMRIGVIGSRENVVQAFRIAVDRAKAKYFYALDAREFGKAPFQQTKSERKDA